MDNNKDIRRIAFLADLHKDIDAIEKRDASKALILKQKFYDLAGYPEVVPNIPKSKPLKYGFLKENIWYILHGKKEGEDLYKSNGMLIKWDGNEIKIIGSDLQEQEKRPEKIYNFFNEIENVSDANNISFQEVLSQLKFDFSFEPLSDIQFIEELKKLNRAQKDILITDITQNPNKENLHNPRQISSFLHDFNADENLKYYTHKWDKEEDFDIRKFRDKAWKSFEAIRKKYPDLPNSMIAKIRAFLFFSDAQIGQGWSGDHIKTGWHSKAVLEWCQKNPGKSPYPLKGNGMTFSEPIILRNQTIIKSFKKLVEKFKSEFEFRDDDLDNGMQKLLKSVINQIDSSFEKSCNLDKVVSCTRLYTDIEKVLQATKWVLKAVYDNLDGNTVEFSFKDINEKEVEFVILHQNSIFKKSEASFNEKIQNSGGDTLGPAKKLLRSLCDWEMITKFSDGKYGSYKVLPEDGFIELPIPEHYEGVKHVFRFYRSE